MIEAFLLLEGEDHRIVQTITEAERPSSIPLILDYLAEGGANVVYRILAFSAGAATRVPEHFHGKLLRLRKDKPFIHGTLEQHGTFKAHFAGLFPPEHLVEQDPVAVREDVLHAVNDDLQRLEGLGRRERLRHGDRVATAEPHGLLVTDMTVTGLDVLLEIKPKWLCQSPNAPDQAMRCRTCALRAQRDVGRGKGDVVPVSAYFCPLALVSPHLNDRAAALQAILSRHGDYFSRDASSELAWLFEAQGLGLLRTLRGNQAKLDVNGILPLQGGIPSTDFLKAMTLRDCTLFVRSKNGVFDVSATGIRLADLDLKHAHADKVRKWRSTEQRLVDEGWYTNTEADRVPEIICLLSQPRGEFLNKT